MAASRHINASRLNAVRADATDGEQVALAAKEADAIVVAVGSWPRTGNYRRGGDELLVDGSGRSWIGYDDYAIALVDELEQRRAPRRRITIGY